MASSFSVGSPRFETTSRDPRKAFNQKKYLRFKKPTIRRLGDLKLLVKSPHTTMLSSCSLTCAKWSLGNAMGKALRHAKGNAMGNVHHCNVDRRHPVALSLLECLSRFCSGLVQKEEKWVKKGYRLCLGPRNTCLMVRVSNLIN